MRTLRSVGCRPVRNSRSCLRREARARPFGRRVVRKFSICGVGGVEKRSGLSYGLTRRKERRGEVGGSEGVGSRSAHSDSNVRKTWEKCMMPVV